MSMSLLQVIVVVVASCFVGVGAVDLQKMTMAENQLMNFIYKYENFKINLSEKCEWQRDMQAKEALLPGKKYNFVVAQPKLKEIRVAVIGDSIAQGCCGRPMSEIDALPIEQRLTDQPDGSQQGLHGWPYLLHQLLLNNNQTDKYTIMNFALTTGTARPGMRHTGRNVSFVDNCKWEQVKKSLPHAVFITLGMCDTHLKDFTEEVFIKNYESLIQEVQALPTKPLIFLVVPNGKCGMTEWGKKTEKNQNWNANEFKEDEAIWVQSSESCSVPGSPVKELYWPNTLAKIANQTGIPSYHIVNAWHLLRETGQNIAEVIQPDGSHLWEKGFGQIAQEMFMKMSFSPDFMQRKAQIMNGQDDDYNQALQQAIKGTK